MEVKTKHKTAEHGKYEGNNPLWLASNQDSLEWEPLANNKWDTIAINSTGNKVATVAGSKTKCTVPRGVFQKCIKSTLDSLDMIVWRGGCTLERYWYSDTPQKLPK